MPTARSSSRSLSPRPVEPEEPLADMYQYRIEKLSGIPGVTCTHKMGFTSIFMFPIDCILKKIPALNKRFDAAALKR